MAGLVPAAVGTELVESCDLCGSRAQDVLFATVTDRLHYLPGRFSLIRCSDCALVRLSPRPDETDVAGRPAGQSGGEKEHGDMLGLSLNADEPGLVARAASQGLD